VCENSALSRIFELTGHVARTDEIRNEYKILVGKPEGNRSLRRSRRRWENNIKMDLRIIGFAGVD
jgi:hypothetical protein